MRRHLITSVIVLMVLTVGLGIVCPFAVTGLADLGFRHQADGSLLERGGTVVGSALLGQSFDDRTGSPFRQYFQPRPSDAGTGYDASASTASNLGPSNPLLVGFVAGVNTVSLSGRPSPTNPFASPADPACVPVTSPAAGQRYARTAPGSVCLRPRTVPERAIAYRSFNGLAAEAPVPVDAVTASGSGLDPGISPADDADQESRVARARHLSVEVVAALVRRFTQGRQLGFLGEPTVNVVELNLALDRAR
jgi:K+-transporting ATPase ATPase C chain